MSVVKYVMAVLPTLLSRSPVLGPGVLNFTMVKHNYKANWVGGRTCYYGVLVAYMLHAVKPP
jgi:hypothetical protein